MMKFILHIICLLVYPFSFLLPRSRRMWAFGSYRGMFNDNSKYLFIHVSERHPEVTAAWISRNRQTVKHVRSLGLRAYHVLSPKGVWFALRSGIWVVNSYTEDILFSLSGRATVVNLWHGLALKQIEFNITSGPLADRYVRQTLREHITHPFAYRRPDLLLTVSECQTEMFAKAFRIERSRCMLLGYPRNEVMFMDEARRTAFIEKYEREELKQLVHRAKRYDEVFIYMPTWRDSQQNLFTQSFNLERLNRCMQERNALMLLKPHPNTKVDRDAVGCHSNIELVADVGDIYPLLAYCNVLITDYSSIMYDFIEMKQNSVILYLYDYADYQGTRDFYFPFDENVTGTKAYSFDELMRIVEHREYTPHSANRSEIEHRFWGNSVAATASEDIVGFIKNYESKTNSI